MIIKSTQKRGEQMGYLTFNKQVMNIFVNFQFTMWNESVECGKEKGIFKMKSSVVKLHLDSRHSMTYMAGFMSDFPIKLLYTRLQSRPLRPFTPCELRKLRISSRSVMVSVLRMAMFYWRLWMKVRGLLRVNRDSSSNLFQGKLFVKDMKRNESSLRRRILRHYFVQDKPI